MPTYSLAQHLEQHAICGAPYAAAVAETVAALAQGAIAIREAVALGALGTAFAATRGDAGAGGDVPKELDLYADELLVEAVRLAPVAFYASEEIEHPVVLNVGAPLALAVDPLDGSSNIDTNTSIGTIFSLLPVAGDADADAQGLSSYLQPGRRQVAAGFFVYGPQLALALTLGTGTDIFVYSPGLSTFVRAYADLSISPSTSEFAINASNYRFWDDGVRHYIDACHQGATGPHRRDFNMRWVASMVADAYRILIRGGIYLYPSDARKGYGSGRLRLVYEANPIAMLMEQAGGLATDCNCSILDRTPVALHEKVPLVFGSRDEVLEVGRYYADANPLGIRSPLFGTRGLFRS
jgi:fructose-1,6-bisphosphatase I